MWRNRKGPTRRTSQFFYVALGYDNLMNHYRVNFALMQHHKYTLSDLEMMVPFERQIYVAMLIEYLEQERQRLENKQ